MTEFDKRNEIWLRRTKTSMTESTTEKINLKSEIDSVDALIEKATKTLNR
ncbi:MAG: hypothetical protein HZC29_08805 [Thaumarchaeota archaeon]|nr:hypothetical protein [Nitrososphaerota archaeon]